MIKLMHQPARIEPAAGGGCMQLTKQRKCDTSDIAPRSFVCVGDGARMPSSAAAPIWLKLAAAAVASGASASDGGSLLPVGLRTELEPSPFGVRLDSTGGIEVSIVNGS